MSLFSIRRFRISEDLPSFAQVTRSAEEYVHTEVIFVLDTSSSMYWVWPYLARSVNNFIRKYTDNQLSATVIQYARYVTVANSRSSSYTPLREDFDYKNLDQSRSDIFQAFSKLKHHLETRRGSPSVEFQFSICFIADGGDTESGEDLPNRLSLPLFFCPCDVSFTTIACGASFPTNISVQLREIFHDPDIEGVPLLTPVRTDPCNFTARFAELIPHLLEKSAFKMHVKPNGAARMVPWTSNAVSHVSLGSWFVVDLSDATRLRLDGQSVAIADVEFGPEDLIAIGQQWVRDLQNSVARNIGYVPEDAEYALAYFMRMYDYIKQSAEALDRGASRSSNSSSRALFDRRLRAKKERASMYEARVIMNELRSLSRSSLDNLTDEQLAQQLAIGTKDSKYLKKTIRWKDALTVDGFLKARDSFRKLHKSLLPKLQSSTVKDPFRSNISLESNVDILTNKLYLDKLYDPIISSQFMLIECFPVVGLALKTYVSGAATINPWLVRVDSVSRLVPYIDTASIYAMTKETMFAKISTGAHEYEEVSAVCPLLVPTNAAAMDPILRSKLYQIVMTFQVTRNMDTVDRASHLALLAAVFSYLVRQPENDWRNDLLDTVVFTADVLSGTRKANSAKSDCIGTMTYVEVLRTKLNIALVTAHSTLLKKCESLSKALLAYALLRKGNKIDDRTLSNVWERFVAEYVGRAIDAEDPERHWCNWFEIPNVVFQGKLCLRDVLERNKASEEDMSRFKSVSDVRRFVENLEIEKGDYDMWNSGLRFRLVTVKKARAMSHGPVEWDSLAGFESHYAEACAITRDEQKLRSFVAHAMKYNNSYERAIHEVEPWNEEIENMVMSHLVQCVTARLIREMKIELALSAELCMTAFMRKTHEKGIVLPMTEDQIRRERKKRPGMETTADDLKKLRYDKKTGLCRGACQNNTCWRFLVADKRFSEHLVNSSPSGGRPMIAFHHIVQMKQKCNVREIELMIKRGCCARRDQEMVGQMNRELFTGRERKLLSRIRAAYHDFEKQKAKR